MHVKNVESLSEPSHKAVVYLRMDSILAMAVQGYGLILAMALQGYVVYS